MFERFKMLTGRTPKIDPIYIHTTSNCTNHCYMCPARGETKKRQYMTDEVFDVVMERLKGYSGNVHLYGQGEPLLDKKIFKRIDRARDVMPEATLHLISNFTVMDDRKRELLSNAPLDRLANSIYGLDEETYSNICGKANYRQAITNQIRFIKQWVKERRYRFMVFVMESEYNEHDRDFIEWFLGILPVTKVSVVPLFRCHNILPRRKNYFTFGKCLFYDTGIGGTGDVSICMSDPYLDMETGNIMDGSLEKVVNGKKARAMRRGVLFGKGMEGFCSVCDWADENKILYFLIPFDNIRTWLQNKLNLNNNAKDRQCHEVAVNTDRDIDRKLVYFNEIFEDETRIPEIINELRDKFKGGTV